MYFELQLSANIFTRIVRNRLKALELCIDREFVDTDGKLTNVPGSVVVVDRIEIGENTSIQREQIQQIVNNLPTPVPGATQVAWIFWPTNYTSFTVPFLQVKQEINIYLVKSSDLDANGPGPTTPFRTLTIQLVFNVALRAANQTQGGGPLSLSYTLAYIDYGILYLFLSDQQRKDIEQYVGGVQLPPTTLDLGALSSLLRRPISGINAGIVCDPSSSFVAMRVDFDVYNSPVAVTPQFFNDPPENLLDGRDWVMLVDREVLLADGKAKSTAALQGDPKIRLKSGPDVSWDPGGPAIDIQAGVELVDACPFFIDNIDMDVDVSIRYELSIPTPNTVRSHYHLHGEPSDLGEEIACAVTGALLWPFIGPLFLKDEDFGAGLGAYLAGLAVGPAIIFVGLIAVIETKKLSKDISDKLGSTCKKIDDENYECNEPVNAVMQLTPTFNSRLEIERVAGIDRGLLFGGSISNLRDFFVGAIEEVHMCPFKWQVVGKCTGNGQSNFHVANQASISVWGTPPAGLCSVRILYDPEQEFAININDNIITIVPQFKPSYVANRYPCRVRIITNRGVRTITLAAPAAKTAGESDSLDKARLAAHLTCYYWEKVFTPQEKIKWLPDPPFDRDRAAQFWQIVVRGMQPHESIHVKDHAGKPLMTANPSRSGVAHIALLLAGDEAQPELALEMRGMREQGHERKEITLQQVPFEHRASVPVAGQLRSMRFEGGGQNRRLMITADDYAATWDVSTPVAPALLRSVETRSDIRKDATAQTRSATAHGRAEEFRDLVIHSGKQIGAAASPNLLRALERVRDRFGVPTVVGSPRVGGIKETLYVRTKAGAALFDISNPEEPREIHVYDSAAWFEDVAMGGKVMAKYNDRLGVIDIYLAALRRGCE